MERIRVLSRAHFIFEAVLSAFGPHLSREELDGFLSDVEYVLMLWFERREFDLHELRDILNGVPSPGTLNFVFEPSRLPHSASLFGDAEYRRPGFGRRDHSLSIKVNSAFNVGYTALPGRHTA